MPATIKKGDIVKAKSSDKLYVVYHIEKDWLDNRRSVLIVRPFYGDNWENVFRSHEVTRMRRLGETQRSVLKSLIRQGYWHKGCGWAWSSDLVTQRHMDRLVEYGYAQVSPTGRYTPISAVSEDSVGSTP